MPRLLTLACSVFCCIHPLVCMPRPANTQLQPTGPPRYGRASINPLPPAPPDRNHSRNSPLRIPIPAIADGPVHLHPQREASGDHQRDNKDAAWGYQQVTDNLLPTGKGAKLEPVTLPAASPFL